MFLVKPRLVNQQRYLLFFDVLCGQNQDAAPHTVKTEAQEVLALLYEF